MLSYKSYKTFIKKMRKILMKEIKDPDKWTHTHFHGYEDLTLLRC
jgi:hypothetical protein